MKSKMLILSLMAFLFSSLPGLAGTMIPGKLYSLNDGSVITCNLEYSTGQGKIEATNPTTGEVFKGNYTVIFVSDIMGRGRGMMKGDQGTIIFLTIEFSTGTVWNLPVGYGDGEDNNGLKYQYQTNPK
ncbi:MAG: hypothetical protein JW801_03040 [Bacteroidales bacterium]|nr:hypothetical protein [Bacteroidales bacterium]